MIVLYDITHETVSNFWVKPFFIGISAALIWVFLFLVKKNNINNNPINNLAYKMAPYVLPLIIGLSLFASVSLYFYHNKEFNKMRSVYSEGSYLTIIGKVEEHRRHSTNDVIREVFKVDSIEFDVYSNDMSFYGYRPRMQQDIFKDKIDSSNFRFSYIESNDKRIILKIEAY